MSEPESRIRTALLGYFPMFIATLSLLTSIYNGYLNNKFVDIIQNNVARVEYMKTCKEIIDAYFQVKFRAGLLSAAGMPNAAPGLAADQIEANSAVNKFAALGTYLANLRDDATRARYTELTMALQKAVDAARTTPTSELDKLFGSADRIFTEMNNDCVRSAKG